MSDSAIEPQTFSFKVAMHSAHVRLDDNGLEMKMGVSKRAIPYDSMRHLYVIPGAMQQAVLSHEVDGKLKRLTMGAQTDEEGFADMIEALVARRPEIDIRHLPAKEANALLGRSRVLIAIGGIIAVLLALVVMWWVSTTVGDVIDP